MTRQLSKHQQGEMRFPPGDPPDATLTVRPMTPEERRRYGMIPEAESDGPGDAIPPEPETVVHTTERPGAVPRKSGGRPRGVSNLAPHQVEAILADFARGQSVQEVARQHNVSRTTVSRYFTRWRQRQQEKTTAAERRAMAGREGSDETTWQRAFGDVAWWLVHWAEEPEAPGALAHEIRFVMEHMRRTYGVDVRKAGKRQEGRRES